MRCEQVKSLLNEYCEGSLSEAMRERVEAHLRGCAACQREAQFVQAIWRGLAAMPEVVPPPDLHARIMTHVRANTRAREAQGRVAFWRWAGAAAVAAGLFIMGVFAAQSDGVQAAFGFGATSKPPAQTPQPVQAGVFLEYRTTADGARIPVLEARMNREATAELRYAPEATQDRADCSLERTPAARQDRRDSAADAVAHFGRARANAALDAGRAVARAVCACGLPACETGEPAPASQTRRRAAPTRQRVPDAHRVGSQRRGAAGRAGCAGRHARRRASKTAHRLELHGQAARRVLARREPMMPKR
jgi:hypothetical protein